MPVALMARFCGTSPWLAMPARLNFLTASPARLECFAETPRNLAGRPEEDGRVFRGPERCPVGGACLFLKSLRSIPYQRLNTR